MASYQKRLEREQKTVRQMIAIYCRDLHRGKDREGSQLCDDCGKLAEYAAARIVGWRFAAHKPVCSKCRVHCYKTELRHKIKKVMQHSGRQMIFRHPVLAVRHFLDGWSNR